MQGRFRADMIMRTISTNWGPFCGCPCNKSPNFFGSSMGPLILETPELQLMFLVSRRTWILCKDFKKDHNIIPIKNAVSILSMFLLPGILTVAHVMS